MSEELKPCPFCGGEAVYNKSAPSEHSYVICDNLDCETMGPTADSEAAAIEAWNTRHTPEGYSLVKNPSLVEKGEPMPQTFDEWHNLAAGYDKAMLSDKAEISRLKSELNNAKQKFESLRGK